MEWFSAPLMVAAAFIIGVIVGYGFRALISTKRRAGASRRRHDFE
jgi:hypothetical protein